MGQRSTGGMEIVLLRFCGQRGRPSPTGINRNKKADHQKAGERAAQYPPHYGTAVLRHPLSPCSERQNTAFGTAIKQFLVGSRTDGQGIVAGMREPRAELHGQRDKLSLGAVVQVALDAPGRPRAGSAARARP